MKRNRIFRKVLCLLLLLWLLTGLAPAPRAAAEAGSQRDRLQAVLGRAPAPRAAAEIKFSGVCGKDGDNLSWTLDNDGVLTISGTGEMIIYSKDDDSPAPWPSDDVEKVVIKKGVTSIGDYAFSGCLRLASVDLPDGLTSIGDHAFSVCWSLESVALPDGLTSIGDYAFSYCSDLCEIRLPDSLTSIGDYAFFDCGYLESIEIPDSVERIGDNPFARCQLETISVSPDSQSLAVVDGVLFSRDGLSLIAYPCGSEREDYAVPDGTQEIGGWAFYDCGLREIRLPDSLTSIGDRAFSESWRLASVVFSNGLRSIGDHAFSECWVLSSVALPDGLRSIGDYAFSNCWELASVEIPGSIEQIGDEAFSVCMSLTEICLPESVTSIGDNPFVGCPLETISVSPDNPSLAVVDGVLFSRDGLSLLAYPGGNRRETYAVPKGVERIGDLAFSESWWLTSVKLPDSLTSIGDEAFSGCCLREIRLPDSLTSIGDGTFSRCSELRSVKIPDSLTSIGDYAFGECESLTKLRLPDSLTSIGDDAFFYCEDLVLTVTPGSYAEEYCRKEEIPCRYPSE